MAVQALPTREVLAGKVPPQNIDAEKAVIGSILIDNESIYSVQEVISASDFYKEAHRKVFDALEALCKKGEPTDFLTVSNFLETRDELNLIGGASYLATLADLVPSSANVISYAKIVREKSIKRRLIEAAAEIARENYEDQRDPEELMDFAEKTILDISSSHARSGFTDSKTIVKSSFKKIEELFELGKPITGLATGFDDLDKITCGLQPDDLIIVAGRPSMGKTAFSINIAEHAAIHAKATVAVFSLEMSKEQLVMRMLCSQARIDSSRLRKGQIEEREWPQLTKAAGHLSEVKLFIDDTPAPTVLEMRAKARRLKREHGLDLLVVDYLQLARGSTYVNSREQEISEISRGLKAMAKELHVPIIALSQLNRAVENRTNRRPQLADLRESGAIEQDADVIAFIYRDEVYDENSPDKGVAEIIIGKQRNGPTGTVRLAFLNTYTKFENLAFNAVAAYGSPVGAMEPDLVVY